MEYLLGIDIGTSGTKVALFNIETKLIAAKTVEYPMSQPYNGWAEQNPTDWWEATVQGVQAVLKASMVSPAAIKGIGLSGQMHGLVMLDSAGQVLRPAIIWCDQRTSSECEEMNQIIGEDKMIEITANPAMTGFTAAKILWVKRHEPEIYERCAHILLPKDYIRYCLTGDFASDVSDASGMQLMDVAKRNWSDWVLEKLEIAPELLPKLYESPEITGTMHQVAATQTGLNSGTPVVAGAGDNPAAAIGTGVISEHKAFITIGSSAVIYTVTDDIHIDPQGRVHTLCASVPGKWTVMSCTQGAGLSLQWLRNNICLPEQELALQEGKDAYYIMDQLAAKLPIGAEKLLFLPYLMGERSPHLDADCRGVFFGLSAMHTRAHLIRAILEGVSFSQRECIDVFREMGIKIDTLIACGGGASSGIWRQMLADLLDFPVSRLKTNEGAALGVALLAGVGVGLYPTIEAACQLALQQKDITEPNKTAGETYEPYYQLYKNLYKDLKKDFKTLTHIGE